ncbi:N-acetylmuramoyl-L-alanine amidase [Paracoccus sp. DMF-8]|uniref:N-acetylmuramoyl-L-alanine amidase n=1 Tax=Paracoccus sp. DMF-8 TaxID=3019445 RepID=UPI0023E7556E|nr:N-acetylmuramoyl-L-alanine amidase [Paracoccus sp. DMF-8]MDF3606144.1 N-acetylmuramoyl-L-alanine amidase [Paracoccus sp. DMF-8]
MTKIALVVGHNARSQGAVRVTDGRSEYDWMGDLSAQILAANPGRYRVFRRPAGVVYTREISQTYAEVDAWGASGSIELHFNAAAASTATGTETLTSGTKGSRRLATLIQSAMVGVLGLRDRGLLVRDRKARGGESLWAGRAPAVLIEPYFGSNAGDCAAADRHFHQLAAGINAACTEFLKG